MKRILVTGGAGFVGSHLCERLLKDGNQVICLDNYYTGRIANVRHLQDNRDFEIMNADVCSPMLMHVDEIYNLACPASPVHYQADPIKTLMTSLLGSLNVLKIARHCNARVLQASTSEVYGDPQVHPQIESYWGNVNPIGERACYDEGKRAAEALFINYNRHYKVRTKIVRIFNTYGPRMRRDDGRVVSNFIIQALTGKDITIYGDGTQTRSFQYVTDLIEGMIKMMATRDELVGPVNIGNPNEFTISELAEKVIVLTQSKSKIVYKDLPSDDPTRRQPDISLAKKELNWEPDILLPTGLILTINYFKQALKDRLI